ncbi:MAG: prepilin-type N-terminal cleavage/methylation domain-containing protein [Tepidisphaeraceae bacterium]
MPWHPPSEQAGRYAFTLVELLVVIGIIAVLIAILLPALSAVRRQADITKCLATERNIGHGAQLHVTTHHGFYPLSGLLDDLPSAIANVTPASLGDADQRKYTYTIDPQTGGTTLAPWQLAIAAQLGYLRATNARTLAELDDAELGRIYYLRLFICPAHVRHASEAPESAIYFGANTSWFLRQSYVINEAVFGKSKALDRYEGQTSRVRRPANTVMLIDGQTSAPRAKTWTRNGQPVNWATLINKVPTTAGPITLADALLDRPNAGDSANFDRVRHKNTVNILFMDGHAESRPISERSLDAVYLIAP